MRSDIGMRFLLRNSKNVIMFARCLANAYLVNNTTELTLCFSHENIHLEFYFYSISLNGLAKTAYNYC